MGRIRAKETGAVPAAPGETRPSRRAALLIARCERADGRVVAVRVRNISATGFGGHCAIVADFAASEPLRVRFPKVAPIAAVLAWHEPDRIGVHFVNPVDLSALAIARGVPVIAGEADENAA